MLDLRTILKTKDFLKSGEVLLRISIHDTCSYLNMNSPCLELSSTLCYSDGAYQHVITPYQHVVTPQTGNLKFLIGGGDELINYQPNENDIEVERCMFNCEPTFFKLARFLIEDFYNDINTIDFLLEFLEISIIFFIKNDKLMFDRDYNCYKFNQVKESDLILNPENF